MKAKIVANGRQRDFAVVEKIDYCDFVFLLMVLVSDSRKVIFPGILISDL